MCGIIGVIGTPNAAKESYLGLLMLQHRGQDSAGIISYDENSSTFHTEKNLGHIKEAVPENTIQNLKGTSAIAHTRYSTIGKIRKEEIQPMVMNYPYGIAMAHNGNIVNAHQIKKELLEKNRRLVLSKNDLEVMMNLLADNLANNKVTLNFESIHNAVTDIFEKVKGGYSTVSIIAGFGLLAFKDPNGLRPLVWGKRALAKEEKENTGLKYSFAVASESKSLEFLGYTDIQELKQGELLYIAKDGNILKEVISPSPAKPCMFEWVYFANADSTIWNKNVYQMRLKFGEIIGEKLIKNFDHSQIDIVVPVPDTSRPSAITISEKLNKPYREVLIKNRYAQRTFILNNQKDREKAVQLKLNVVKQEVENKSVLLVDDSIVRGTTSKRIIKLLKDNGAKNVFIASTCPPIKHPCYYGIDFPNENELIASNKSDKEIASSIGADAVFYIEEGEFKKSFSEINTCMACINGEYPVSTCNSVEMINTRIDYEEPHIPRIC